MMDVKDLGKELASLENEIRKILSRTGTLEYNEINISSDKENPQEQFLKNEYANAVDLLHEVYSNMEYLDKPIRHEGKLYKNEFGRYELSDSVVFTSGNLIEFLFYDTFDECNRWVKSRIEHSDGDYYIVGFKNVALEGLEVRTRR